MVILLESGNVALLGKGSEGTLFTFTSADCRRDASEVAAAVCNVSNGNMTTASWIQSVNAMGSCGDRSTVRVNTSGRP